MILTEEEIQGLLTDSWRPQLIETRMKPTRKHFVASVEDRLPIEDSLQPDQLMAPLDEQGLAAPYLTGELLERDKFIVEPLNMENIGDDGMDFTIGTTIYASDILLSEQISLGDLEDLKRNDLARKVDLEEGQKFDFHPRIIYYVLSKEKVRVPADLKMIVDSKSTIGRLGCLCHDATDGNLFKEPVHLIGVVRPYVFPLKVTAGKSRLLQGVFTYKGDSHMTRKEILESRDKISAKINNRKINLEKILIEDKLVLHFSTHKVYVSKPDAWIAGPIDIEAKGDDRADWEDYFDEGEVFDGGKIILEPGKFYLLGTKENISFGGVCGRLSRDYGGHLTGLWSQFAGLIHAGFNGEITLECRTDEKRIIKDGDLAGTIEMDALSSGYKASGKGSYLGQKAPKLPKVFKEDWKKEKKWVGYKMMGGIFGIKSKKPCVDDLLMGIFSLQHRGQDCCGAVTKGKKGLISC